MCDWPHQKRKLLDSQTCSTNLETEQQPRLDQPVVDAASWGPFLDMYFDHIHPRWPVLHRESFMSKQQPPILLRTVVTIGRLLGGAASEMGAEARLDLEALIKRTRDELVRV